MQYSPCDTNRLRHLKSCNQSLPIDGSYLIYSQPSSYQYKRGVESFAAWLRDFHKVIFVDIRPIASGVYSD